MRTRVVLLGVFAVACTAPDDAAVGIDAAEAADTNVQRRDAAIAPPPMTEAPLKGPFVMQPTTTSVVIRWESVLAPAHVEVDYAPQAGGTAPGGRHHADGQRHGDAHAGTARLSTRRDDHV